MRRYFVGSLRSVLHAIDSVSHRPILCFIFDFTFSCSWHRITFSMLFIGFGLLLVGVNYDLNYMAYAGLAMTLPGVALMYLLFAFALPVALLYRLGDWLEIPYPSDELPDEMASPGNGGRDQHLKLTEPCDQPRSR